MTARPADVASAPSSFFSAGALVFCSTLVMSVGGYVYNAIAGRHLGVSDYGALYTLIALYTIAILPVALIGPVIAKQAAELHAHGDSGIGDLFMYLVRTFGILGGLVLAVACVLSYPIGAFVHLPPWTIVIVGAMAAVAFLSAAVRAFSQGVHAYRIYSASVIGEGVTRVGAIALFALFGLTIAKGAWAFFVGLSVGAIIVTVPFFSTHRTSGSYTPPSWSSIVKTMGAAASLASAISLIGFADVVIVKHFFSASDSGLYSASSLCAKVLLYFVSFIPAVLIPQAAHRHARGARTAKTFWMPTLFVAIVSLVAIGGYTLCGPLILRIVVGPGFAAAAALLPLYGGAMAFLSLANTMGSYALATNKLRFALPLMVTTLLTIAIIAVVHPSLIAVTQELLLGTFLMALATAAPIAMEARAR